MGQRTRHFCALMKKNWIVWKRTLGASLCELFCPVVLMAILVLARALISKEVKPPSSNMSKSLLMAPLPTFSNFGAQSTTPSSSDQPSTLDPIAGLTQSFTQYQAMYGQFAGFTQTNLTTGNPITSFFPAHCQKSRNDKALPLIAVAGPSKYVDPIVKDLESITTLQNVTRALALEQAKSDPRIMKYAQALGINLDPAAVTLKVKQFSNHQAIYDYLSSPQYEQNNENPGICFGFSIEEPQEDDVRVKILFSATPQDPNFQGIPSQLESSWSEFDVNADDASFQKYSRQGYAILQNWIANSVLRVKSGTSNANIAFALIPTITDSYVTDDFGQIMTGILPFFMLLIYILPVYRLVSNIVSEKESRARETMKMMGLSDLSYWLSWACYYFIIVTIITVLIIIVLSPTVLEYSNKGMIFVIFWVYGLSLFGLSVFLSSFFSTARAASITSTLIYFGTSFVNQAVLDQSVKINQKSAASLLTTVAINLASVNIAQFETSGIGVQSSNLGTQYRNYTLSRSIGVMILSLFLFLFVGLYLEQVLPSSYGLRKHWCFLLSPSYWCGKERKQKTRKSDAPSKSKIDEEPRQTVSPSKIDELFESKDKNPLNFEPVQKELLRQEADQKILKITDLRKTFDNGFQAVKGLNVKMYTGQIFALLGHNGAGKTTTISMLTGLIGASSGQAEVLGMDLFEDMDSVRQKLGVCPQHDVLFNLLTPEEHLDIFCDFKGVDSKLKKEEIRKMLIDVDVFHHKDKIASSLSGGSKRKLSVAIALIGGSQFVLLDEPTSGMDLSARRKLWNMLKNYKTGRIIILTTHYMDEADILGDRIGIMTGGQLLCLGSSLFLKNRFGVGYNLTMVKKSKEQNNLIEPYLRKEENLGNQIKKLSEVSSEITFQIPSQLSERFKNFFTRFDQDLDGLGIRSYGISVTTLEEVFLKVGHGDDSDKDIQELAMLKQHSPSEQQPLTAGDNDFTISNIPQVSAFVLFFQHLSALFLKRFYIYRRNRKGLIVEVLVPVLLVIIGFAFSKVQFFVNQPERNLSTNLYPLPQRIIANEHLVVGDTDQYSILPQSMLSALPNANSAFQVTLNPYNQYQAVGANQTAYGMKFDQDTFDNRLVGSYSPYRFGSYFLYESNNATKQFKAAVFLNLTSQDVTVAYPQYLYEAILKQALGRPNLKYSVSTVPYPVTQKLRNRAATASGFFISFIVSIAFALVPAVVVSFILNEREKNLKHMQIISGMSLTAYWVSNFIFDVLKGLIPSAIVIGLIYAFGLDYDTTWVLFLLYPVGVIPFTYVSSFLFSQESVAQTITIFIHFVFAGIGPLVTLILRFIDSTKDVGDVLTWVFKVIPTYCLTEAIIYDSSKTRLFLIRPDLKRDSDYDVTLMGGNILVLMIHCGLWLFVLLLIEAGAFSWTSRILALLPKNRITPKTDEQLSLDEDVIEEETRVETARDLKVRVNKFRKVYPGLTREAVLAVERTSFGLDYGECFALLGINGAGKSTTFKALTCEIPPSAGQIHINGFNVQRQFDQARKLIGYCPQHDAIFDLVTVEEHLQYYARIKGIPARIRQQLIEKQIVDMNLSEHRDKPAGTLSGGNKRKLSVAMAIIGNPPIILLDEPSAGMDPEARRFMWNVVARISQQRKQSAVILTTHSMEEAEALSTKMGIMVKGGVFRCFGSSQHIKNKFGTGYEIEIKIRKLPISEIDERKHQYGIQSDSMTLEELKNLLVARQVDKFLIDELKMGGLGEDLVREAQERRTVKEGDLFQIKSDEVVEGTIDTNNALNWIYIEEAGMKIINELVKEFPSVEILEHYSDYYKLRIPRGDKSIGFVFGFIEGRKQDLKISEYSVSQTTLEQIFQAFANQNIDDENARKLTFRQINSRAELYSDRTYVRQTSKDGQISKQNRDNLNGSSLKLQ